MAFYGDRLPRKNSLTLIFARNDDGRVDCHDSSLFHKSLESCNDEISLVILSV
ncbi:hypothetical protein [Helicobacter sp. T3_23-1056]